MHRPSILAALLLLVAVLLEAPSARAQPFPLPTDVGWATALWSDGGERMVVASSGKIVELTRGGGSLRSVGVPGARAVAGSGQGDQAILVVVGDGQVARWRSGAWAPLAVPVKDGESLAGAAVDASGRLFVAGERRALYVHAGDRWSVHEYPRSVSVNAVAAGAPSSRGSTVYLAGRAGTLIAFAEGEFQAVATGLPDGGGATDYRALWWSPSGTLWAAGDSHVLAVDLSRGRSTKHAVPLFGTVRVLCGLQTTKGDLVAVGAQSGFAVVDAAGAHALPDAATSFPEALVLDGRDHALYVASRHGLHRFVVDHPWLRGEDLPAPPAPPRAAPPAAAERRDDASAPSPPAEAARDKDAPSLFPTGRLGIGPGLHPRAGGSAGSSFNFDAGLGVRVPVKGRWMVWPEIAYSSSTDERVGGQFAVLGAGPLYGTNLLAVGISPRLVLGSARGDLAIGPRTSAVLTALYGVVSVEVGHQWLHTASLDDHELRVMLAIDGAPILAAGLVIGLIHAIFH